MRPAIKRSPLPPNVLLRRARLVDDGLESLVRLTRQERQIVSKAPQSVSCCKVCKICRLTICGARPASAVFPEKLFEEFAPAARALVRVFIVKDELRDWNDAETRFHNLAPLSRSADCNDSCSHPGCGGPNPSTPSDIPPEKLTANFSKQWLKRNSLCVKRPMPWA